MTHSTAPTEATAPTATDELIVTRRGSAARLGHLELNRPRALNSLSFAMVQQIDATLRDWADDDDVEAVLITGAGDRGLCAGGDIVAVYQLLTGQRATEAEHFFFVEYGMNHRIAHFPKPYIALMDGIVLGGGLGVSAHGSHRVVTERTRIGMPEVGIGFTPDVGLSYLLSRAPGRTGMHLALTGAHVSGADAIYLGLADHFVPSERLEQLRLDLETLPPDEAIARHATASPASEVQQQRDWIDRCYAPESLADIIGALDAEARRGNDSARTAADTLRRVSPTALAVTHAAQLRLATIGSLAEALTQEYRIGVHLMHGADMVEGIRAQVIDKDRSPRWSPARLEEVSDDDIAAHFDVPASGDFELPRS
ncbi:enoyl-CoA hydratase/isomerase family protein [Citricoccus muralis]|uniref:3-hydroxyisobutyryl-CoA hydrolase n=1 Tax=Citricoccus muralis TaxID=169134 RepID=A0ABY8H7H7_9MICC|nr:enoyl-CoA hydratase/isomerase family protein [Citricoccus muralis]WFP17107.1 enoyl-CoA hydratase/isomerase family protein [Citricoccus muralis]